MSDILFKHVEILLSGNKNISLFHLPSERARLTLIIYCDQCFILIKRKKKCTRKDNKIRLFDLILRITFIVCPPKEERC